MEEQNQQPKSQPEKSKKLYFRITIIVGFIVLIIIGAVVYHFFPQISLNNLESKYGSLIMKIEGVFDSTDVHWDFRDKGTIHYTEEDGFFNRKKIAFSTNMAQADVDMSKVRSMLITMASENFNYKGDCSGTDNSSALFYIPGIKKVFAQVNIPEVFHSCTNSRYYFDITFGDCTYSAYTQYCALMPRSPEESKDDFLQYIDSILSQTEIPTVSSVYNQYYTDYNGVGF